MEKDWVKIYTTHQVYQAEILKKVLADNDIGAITINKRDSSYRTFGDIEVYVRIENVLKAKKLAKEFDS